MATLRGWWASAFMRLSSSLAGTSRCDGSFLPPVHLLRNIHNVLVAELIGRRCPPGGLVSLQSQVTASELLMAQIGKLVQPQPVLGDLLVPFMDVLQVVLEHLESLQLLLYAVVNLAVLGDPCFEQFDEPADGGQVLRCVSHDGELMGCGGGDEDQCREGQAGDFNRCGESHFWSGDWWFRRCGEGSFL